jgi:DNA-binding transcriptional regulator YiaG
MTPRRLPSTLGTLTAGQGSHQQAREGVVTGHLFKITRERTGLTQSELAAALEVDVTTIQGWESGRRPLTASSSIQFRAIRRHLLRCGADPALLVLFDIAMDADAVLAHALDERSASEDFRSHPLANWVFTRTSSHLIAWTLNGTTPAALPPAPAGTPRRRGPTPQAPLLAEPERRVFFDHLRRCAEIADRAGEAGALLRRQALYLCSYDAAPETHAWLADMRSRSRGNPVAAAWKWADARSLATSLTRYGELDELHRFIEQGMGSDAGETANLNYWAYWLGLDRLPRADDSFMNDRSPRLWDGGALLRSLIDRLNPELGCVDLNVHSVWALLAARPGLLATDDSLVHDLKDRVDPLLDSDRVSKQSRRELEAVHYGLKLNTL